MSKNVVLWDGTVVSVDDDTAAGLGQNGRELHPTESQSLTAAKHESEVHSAEALTSLSPVQRALLGPFVGSVMEQGGEAGVSAFAGFADTASFGLAGKLDQAIDSEEHTKEQQGVRQAHPYAGAFGDVVGLLTPGGAMSAVGKGAKFANLGKWGTRALEGAAIGVDSHVAQSNVTGDPLTIQGTLEAATIDAVVNMAFGGVGDVFGAAGARLRAGSEEAAAVRAKVAEAKTGRELFENNTSYETFRSAHESAQDAAKEFNRGVDRAAKEWTEWTSSPNAANAGLKDFEKVQGEIREQMTREVETAWKAGLNPEEAGRPLADASNAIKSRSDEIRSLLKDENYEMAAQKMRSLSNDIRSAGFGEVKLPEVPLPPVNKLPVLEVALPKAADGFARMSPEKIAELANGLTDSTSVEAFKKFAADIGMKSGEEVVEAGVTRNLRAPQVNVPELVAGTHASLKGYVSVMEKVSEMAARENAPGLLNVLRRGAKRGAAGFAASMAGGAVAGPLGAFAAGFGGKVAADVVETAMTSAESRLLNATLMEGKLGARSKVLDVIEKATGPAQKAAYKAAPVMSYLAVSFPSGKKDPEIDPRKRAVNRMREFTAASQVAPDALFTAFRKVLGHPGNIAYKMATHIQQGMAYLVSQMPKDPGTNRKGLESKWQPSHQEVDKFAHQVAAFLHPTEAMYRMLQGRAHPAATDILKVCWSALTNELGSAMAQHPEVFHKANYRTNTALSQLFGNFSALSQSEIVLAIQSTFMPPQQAGFGNQPGRAPGFGRSPHAVGRPAAVQSEVAGASPSNLINQ